MVDFEENVDNNVDLKDLVVEYDAIFSNLEKEVDEADTSDVEYMIARDRVRECNNKLNELAQQLQREAVEGRLGAQKMEALLDLSKRGYHLVGLSV